VTAFKSILLFVVAALFEIGGAWMVWQGVREHRGWLWAGAGVLALGAYGFVAAFQPDAHFGRVLAAYGGVFIAGSLGWGMVADGFHPSRSLGRRGCNGVPDWCRADHVRPALSLQTRRKYGCSTRFPSSTANNRTFGELVRP